MTQTTTSKLSQQIAKVRAKIADYKAANEYADQKSLEVDYDADFSEVLAAQDLFLEAKKRANRIAGEIKRMARKAVEMYYGCSCEWYAYESASLYISKFNETFRNWN